MYEYMAAEKPVIATKLPGIVKEFGFNHGIMYVNGPEEVLNKANELVDAEIRHFYGDKSRRFVESNSWDIVTKNFEKILEDMIHVS